MCFKTLQIRIIYTRVVKGGVSFARWVMESLALVKRDAQGDVTSQNACNMQDQEMLMDFPFEGWIRRKHFATYARETN